VIQEYINRTWLMQNIRLDMKAADMAKVIENAPVVEIDTDLLHDIETARGRRKNRVEWAVNETKRICGDGSFGWPGMTGDVFHELVRTKEGNT
jgi:hypothetical protein